MVLKNWSSMLELIKEAIFIMKIVVCLLALLLVMVISKK
jgi:hypothetical protein